MRLVFSLFAVLLSLGAACAQSMAVVDRHQAALIEAWEKMPLTSAPPGDHVVEYKLHDIASDKTANFNMPFKIAS